MSRVQQSMVEHVVKAGGPTFADSFVGYLIGLLASVMSVVLGQMFALYIFELNIQGARWLCRKTATAFGSVWTPFRLARRCHVAISMLTAVDASTESCVAW
eukprot:6213542-Pleurochrysis_carterae.AAC.3